MWSYLRKMNLRNLGDRSCLLSVLGYGWIHCTYRFIDQYSLLPLCVYWNKNSNETFYDISVIHFKKRIKTNKEGLCIWTVPTIIIIIINVLSHLMGSAQHIFFLPSLLSLFISIITPSMFVV
jgi:hypothetical protein